MTTGILIIHTPSQMDDASALVDLLESSLELPAGAISCSSVPGYAWAEAGEPPTEHVARFSAALESAHAAIALVDDRAYGDPQLWFDFAAAWARGKRVAVLADSAQRRTSLPLQIGMGAPVIERMNRAALVGLVEDLAYDFGVSPRIGENAQRAIELLSSAPPPPTTETELPTLRPEPADDQSSASMAAVPRAPYVPSELVASQHDPTYEIRDDEVEALPRPDQISDDEVEALLGPREIRDDEVEAVPPLESAEAELVGASGSELEPLREPLRALDGAARSAPVLGAYRLSAFEAGRAISECSFHREQGGDFAAELESTFGSFIDTIGGNWRELKRFGDLEVWLGATDNLLAALPEQQRYIVEWYELGFQFARLQSIAELEPSRDPAQQASYRGLWEQSMAGFCQSAHNAHIAPLEVGRQQALLETLIGPERHRGYANVARALEQLRGLAAGADLG